MYSIVAEPAFPRWPTTERLRADPIFGQLIGGRAVVKGGASVSQMFRFETEMLPARGNLLALFPGSRIAQIAPYELDLNYERSPKKSQFHMSFEPGAGEIAAGDEAFIPYKRSPISPILTFRPDFP